MTQHTRNQEKQHSLITDSRNRTAVLALCISCFEKAKSERQFFTMIQTLELGAEFLSQYPTLDAMLIRSVGIVLADAGRAMQRWNQ